MADELLKIEGIQELMTLVKTIGDMKPVRDSIKVAAIHLKGKMAVYPAKKRPSLASVYGKQPLTIMAWGRPVTVLSPFKTAKQHMYFFAALRKGTLDVPYRRGESAGSETFGRRWNVQTENYGMRAVVGNNASYGPLLMDDEQQTLYAKAVGWKTVQAIMRAERDTVTEIVTYGFRKLLQQ